MNALFGLEPIFFNEYIQSLAGVVSPEYPLNDFWIPLFSEEHIHINQVVENTLKEGNHPRHRDGKHTVDGEEREVVQTAPQELDQETTKD